MRKAEDFVEEYRRKGYPDERVKIIASMRPEPLRSEVLRVLQQGGAGAVSDATDENALQDPADKPAVNVIVEESATEIVPPEAEAAAVPVKDEKKKKAPSIKGKVAAAQEKQDAAVRAERNKMSVELKKSQEDLKKVKTQIEKTRADSAEIAVLRKKLKSSESLQKDFDKVREEKAKLESRCAELEGELEGKKKLLVERENILNEKTVLLAEMKASLDEERAEHIALAVKREELTEELERQAEQLQEFEAVNQKMNEFSVALDDLQTEATKLQEREQEKSARVVELEGETAQYREEAAELHGQIETNEQAVEELQERLTARESELEALRAHFDLEAGDLKRRADQEIRIVQRQLRSMRAWKVGTMVAACISVFLFIGYVSKDSGGNQLQNNLSVNAPDQGGDSRDGLAHQPGPEVYRATHIENTTPGGASANRVEPPILPLNQTPAIGGAEGEGSRVSGSRVINVQMPVATPRTKVIEYTVKSGDSMFLISQRLLGDGNEWRKIAKENGIPISQANRLKLGQKLKVTVPVE